MRHSTHVPVQHDQLTSSSTSDVQTFTTPKDASAVLIAVETTDARITFDGTAPAADNGLIYPAAQMPVMVLVGPGCTVKAASTAAADSIVNLAWLR